MILTGHFLLKTNLNFDIIFVIIFDIIFNFNIYMLITVNQFRVGITFLTKPQDFHNHK